MPTSYTTQVPSPAGSDSQTASYATQTSHGSIQDLRMVTDKSPKPPTTQQTQEEFMGELYKPLHQLLVDSLFGKGEKNIMVNSELAPSDTVQIEVQGDTVTRKFVEPWTGLKDTTTWGVAMDCLIQSRQLQTAGKYKESQSKLDSANTIGRIVTSVAKSHAQELASVADIRRDIQTLLPQFGISLRLAEEPFDRLVEAYSGRTQDGTPFDRATMKVALSHLIFKEEEEARQERELDNEQAELKARTRMQEWMEQTRG